MSNKPNYRWTCPKCGKHVFLLKAACRGTWEFWYDGSTGRLIESSPDDVAYYQPATVKCEACGKRTKNPAAA
jgi:rRNA maturation protein Nop10